MAITIEELILSYPDFKLGEVIDPEEFDTNNWELVTKLNETIDKVIQYSIANDLSLQETKDLLQVTITDLNRHKTSADHDSRYYTESEIDTKVTTINNTITSNTNNLQTQINTNKTNITTNTTAISSHRTSADHDSRYYTESEVDAKLNGKSNTGHIHNDMYYDKSTSDSRYLPKEEFLETVRRNETNIKYEVYEIISGNNGDGTFTYKDKLDNEYVGSLGENGEQIFPLLNGYYEVGFNRIEITINDTLTRSVASGGIEEVDSFTVKLVPPEGTGAEVTIKYYETIALPTEFTLHCSPTKPSRNVKAMWFKI